MGILVAGIAHEINNPMTYCVAGAEAARGLAGRLIETSSTTHDVGELRNEVAVCMGQASEALSDALDGASRATQLVRDLLVFARTGSAETSTVDVRSAVEASLRIVRQPLRHVARLKLALGDAQAVRGSESSLVQVFVNLLINAVQAITERPSGNDEITIAMRQAEGEVIVEVSDTGPGIPAGARARIFDAFFTTKAAGIGTGLGLSICHRIVTSMGGRLEAESRGEGGTTLRVVLPTN